MCIYIYICLYVSDWMFVCEVNALFSITVQNVSLTLFSAFFLCFVFCMLNLAYSGLVLFGKFLWFCILVHVFKFCSNVIFVPIFKAVLSVIFFALLPFSLAAGCFFYFKSLIYCDSVPGLFSRMILQLADCNLVIWLAVYPSYGLIFCTMEDSWVDKLILSSRFVLIPMPLLYILTIINTAQCQ